MGRTVRLALVVLTLAASLFLASPAFAAGDGAISGLVVNKTPGGAPVGMLQVTLTTYSNGKETGTPQQATVDSSGKFEFKVLSTDNGTAYTVSTNFQGAGYTSKRIALTPASPAQQIELDVYDSTTSDENIKVSNGHIVVFAEDGHLDVLEAWRFNNAGDKTFIGAKGNTLVFTLPAGALQVSGVEGTSLVTTATGAAYNAAVPPGTTDINLTYMIPFEGSSVAIARITDYPVTSFRLLVEDSGMKVASGTLVPAATQMMNGANFQNFTKSNVAKGVMLDASFSEIVSQPSDSPASSFPLTWLLAGAGMLALMVVFALTRTKNREPVPQAVAPQDDEALLMQLARLDDAYEAGEIEQAEYRSRRARLKGSLIGIYSRRK